MVLGNPSEPVDRRTPAPVGEPVGRRPSDVNDEWGRSESLDPDNVGDIADEGAGHRG